MATKNIKTEQFKSEFPEHLKQLADLCLVLHPDPPVTFDRVKAAVDAVKDKLVQPSAAVTKAMQKHASELKDEQFLHGWLVVQHSAAGLEKERLLIVTDKAMIRLAYNFKGGKVDKMERVEWSEIGSIHAGMFHLDASAISVSGHTLKKQWDKYYGFRVYRKDAKTGGGFLPFASEATVDRAYRTMRPVVSDDKMADPTEYTKATTLEIVAILGAAYRAGRPDLQECNLVVEPDGGIHVFASRGLTATIFNKIGIGVSDKTSHKKEGEPESPKSEKNKEKEPEKEKEKEKEQEKEKEKEPVKEDAPQNPPEEEA